MQRILFILTVAVTLLFGADKAYAQRDLPGQTGIQFTSGGVDHFLSWKSGGERHYFTSLAFTLTNRNRTLFYTPYAADQLTCGGFRGRAVHYQKKNKSVHRHVCRIYKDITYS